MNAKKWLIKFSMVLVILTGLVIDLMIYLLSNKVPVRFSNSISYDAKLNYLKYSKILDSANTIVVGSSMGLNNIDGNEVHSQNKVANISSWNLQTSEVLQLINLIKLNKIKYIIYSTQALDFEDRRLKKIDEKDIEDFLYKDYSIGAYLHFLSTLKTNLPTYLKYKEKHLNSNQYTYLNFDETGDVNFEFDEKFINQKRWNIWKNKKFKLSEGCFDDLIELSKISKLHNVKLIVLTTPVRAEMFKDVSFKYIYIYIYLMNI